MKKKLFIIFTIIILITLFIVTILFVKQKQIDSKSINIKLDKNYLTSDLLILQFIKTIIYVSINIKC